MDGNDDLRRESQRLWEQNADFWDGWFGDAGNAFHRTIVEPAVLGLLALEPGERVLEIACGNGAFARVLAQRGAQVVASDFSATFLERAQARSEEYADRIDFRQIDATREDELLALGEQRFDAAVSNMALMDMAAVEPLFQALSRLLRPGGRFVFSLAHPCFNSPWAVKMVEQEERGSEIVSRYALKVSRYLTPGAARSIGIVGQPEPHILFHRPLSLLLQPAFRAGFVLDGLEEAADPGPPDAARWAAWENYKETPPVLAARLRLR